MKPRAMRAMRFGLPPVAGTEKISVGACRAESPAPSPREKYTRPLRRPTNSACTLPGTMSLFLRVASSMVPMPAGVSTMTSRPSGVRLFWWKYSERVPGSVDSRTTRCPVAVSIQSTGGCASGDAGDASEPRQQATISSKAGADVRRTMTPLTHIRIRIEVRAARICTIRAARAKSRRLPGGPMPRNFLLAALAAACIATAHAAGSFPVKITVDARTRAGTFVPIWRFFGADEPNYATMKDGRQLLGELGVLRPGDVYFRAHNLLTSGDGTPAFKWGSTDVYREESGSPRYDWRVIDGIFDAYLASGLKPYVELGFMPQALSTAPESLPYKHSWRPTISGASLDGGWAWPPRDYQRWSDLCFELTRHFVQRYGEEEVRRWWFETWNEANLAMYWHGTPEEFYKLHDFAIAGVRRALPTARVGGPDTAGHGGTFMEGFLDHITAGRNFATGETGTPVDFLSFHAKGSPTFVDGHVRMGIREQLQTIDQGFRMIAARAALAGKPIVIGESDPEGCAACQGPRLGYRNGTMYSSYTAASFARKYALAARHGVNLQGALTWAFTFEDQPYFAGFRQLASNGLDLPVLNVFRMLARMRGERVPAASSRQIALDDILANGVRGQADVGVLASRDERQLAVLVWHYHDDDVPGDDAAVELDLSGLPRQFTKLTHYRIDRDHSNSYAAWQRMGSPLTVDAAAYGALREAGQLARLDPADTPLRRTRARDEVRFTLPRQGVSLLVFSAAP